MIRVNLFGEKVDKTGIYLVQVIAFVGLLIVTVFVCYLTYSATELRKESLAQEKQILIAERNKLNKQTREVEGLEKKRDLLRDKLSTISKLKTRKRAPVHVLDELSTHIPAEALLDKEDEDGGRIQVDGIALDNQTVARFMVNLKRSEYFGEVDLIQSLQRIRDNVKLQQFSVKAKLQNMLKLEQGLSTKEAVLSELEEIHKASKSKSKSEEG